MWCIEQANNIYNWKDFNELIIFTGDYEKSDYQHTYSKINSFNKIVPDFNFNVWPQAGINDYNEQIIKIDEAGKNNFQINKVGWFGNVNTPPNRKIILNIGNSNKELFEFNSMDLIEKTQWCLTNYYDATIIAENAYEFSKKYLTREVCYKQWNNIINDNIKQV